MKKFKLMTLAVVMTTALGSLTAMAAEKWNVAKSAQKFVVNGRSVNASALNIDGSNYVKVAEFAELLNIDIHFDEKTNTITFDKTKPYTGVRKDKNNEVNSSYFRMEGENKFIDLNVSELKGNATLCVSGMFMNKGETIRYDITGEGSGDFIIYCTSNEPTGSDQNGLYRAGSKTDGISNELLAASNSLYRVESKKNSKNLNISGEFLVESYSNQYYFYITNKSDTPIQNITGTIKVSPK